MTSFDNHTSDGFMKGKDKASSEKNAYHWYFLPTKDEYLAKQLLDEDENIKETFLPVKQQMKGDKLTSKLFIPLYIFVYGTLDDILSALADEEKMSYTRNMLSRNPQAHRIPSEEMERFKSCCEANLKLGFLRNPYQFFKKNDIVKVLSGPFKGAIGKLEEIKGDLKLILNFGGWAMWVGQTHKYQLEVDYNHTAYKTEQGQLGRWQEYFATKLASIGIVDGFNLVFRSTLSDLVKVGTFEKLQKEVKQSYIRFSTLSTALSDISDEISRLKEKIQTTEDTKKCAELQAQLVKANAKKRSLVADLEAVKADSYLLTLKKQKMDFVNSLTSDSDQEALEKLATYFRKKEKTDSVTLRSYFPDTNLRSFLTPIDMWHKGEFNIQHNGFEERVKEVVMTQGIYNGDRNTADVGDIPYHAHFAVVPQSDGCYKIFINQYALYQKYVDMDDEQKRSLWKKLVKGRFYKDSYRPFEHFLSVLPIPECKLDSLLATDDEMSNTIKDACLNSAVKLDCDDKLHIYGLSIPVGERSGIDTGISNLLSAAQTLYKEVLEAVNLRPYQKAICASWVRRKEDYDIYFANTNNEGVPQLDV